MVNLLTHQENENENQKYHLTSEHQKYITIQFSVRIQSNGNSHTLFMGMRTITTTLGNWQYLLILYEAYNPANLLLGLNSIEINSI